MLATKTLPRPLHLNPYQQWQQFSRPRAMHDWLRERYGDLAPVHFQGRDFAAVLTAAAAKDVFTTDPASYDAFWKESFDGLLGGQSVWTFIGEKHRKERQLFAPAVHANHFRDYGKQIRNVVCQNLAKWHSGRTIKALDTTLSISLDIILRLVFGVNDEELFLDGQARFARYHETVHPLIVFFPQLQQSWFPLWRRYTRARADVFDWMTRLIEARRARKSDDSNVLGVLMNAMDEEGQPFSDEYIHTELISILTAGHETTAVALAWALYELGRHPEIMAKLRTEIQAAGPNLDPGLLHTLPYLDAVCNETVRLHPVLAECARVPIIPVHVLGYSVPPGQALVVSIVAVHHDPAVYDAPDQFVPERFIRRNYSVFEFLPFGGGHRRCMGAGLAKFSMRIALAQIVQDWDFEPVTEDHDTRLNIAMGPQHGVPLQLTRRQPSLK